MCVYVYVMTYYIPFYSLIQRVYKNHSLVDSEIYAADGVNSLWFVDV